MSPVNTTARPSVTIVVPARNEEDRIKQCLDAISVQTCTDTEILVVDADSEDRTAALVREASIRDPRIRLIENPQRLIPIGLNLALAEARGTWWVRIDAHAYPPPDYVERLVSLLQDTDAGGAGGQKRSIGSTDTGAVVAVAMRSKVGVGNSPYHFDGERRPVDHVPFGAYRIERIRAINGWNEEFPVHQDFEFDYRMRRSGHEIVIDPSIVIDWSSRETLGDLFAQYRRYGIGKAHMLACYPDSVRSRHVIPSIAVVGVVGSVILSFIARIFIVPVVLYAALLLAGSIPEWRRHHDWTRRQRLTLPITFAALHAGWGIGLLEGVWRWRRELAGRGSSDATPRIAH